MKILFFGPCIFNNEDEKINQQNAQINSGLILLLINHSNLFRPLSRSHHQGVRNPWELQSHCIDLKHLIKSSIKLHF